MAPATSYREFWRLAAYYRNVVLTVAILVVVCYLAKQNPKIEVQNALTDPKVLLIGVVAALWTRSGRRRVTSSTPSALPAKPEAEGELHG